jgi:hypothetical protein
MKKAREKPYIHIWFFACLFLSFLVERLLPTPFRYGGLLLHWSHSMKQTNKHTHTYENKHKHSTGARAHAHTHTAHTYKHTHSIHTHTYSHTHTHIQTHTAHTLGRTGLDEWSASRRDLYLATHNTHKRQLFISRLDSNSQSQKASSRRPKP